MAQAVNRRLLTASARFKPRSHHVRFVVVNVALVQVLVETSVSPAFSHFINCSIFFNHPPTDATVFILRASLNNR